jgi:hypothetical protein
VDDLHVGALVEGAADREIDDVVVCPKLIATGRTRLDRPRHEPAAIRTFAATGAQAVGDHRV